MTLHEETAQRLDVIERRLAVLEGWMDGELAAVEERRDFVEEMHGIMERCVTEQPPSDLADTPAQPTTP